MGKLQNIITNLSKEPAPATSVEIGTSTVGLMPTIFDEEFVDMSKVKVEDFKLMLDSDGTIQALYNSIVMPLLSCSWTIEPDGDSPAAIEQAAWVEEALRKPPHKGGMSTPFDLVLAQALRAVVEGFAGFEKVYEISEGKIVFKKIAWRDPSTITLRTDDRGGFNGLRQRAFIGSDYVDAKIPLEKCFLYTYGKEFHNLKGRSAFTAAYVAYDKKRRLLYLAEQQAQADALRLKVVKGKEGGTSDELIETTEAVDEVGFKATVGLPYGYDVDTLNNTNGMDLLPHIEFQNAEMARSVLAMFILLGTGSKTGSYSLSQDQSDFFIKGLMSIRRSLEQHITSYLIPDLYKFNFETPEFGTFKFEDITDSTIDLLKQTFIKLTEKDRLPDSVVEGVVQKMADKLEIDVDLMEEATSGIEQPREVPSVPEEIPVAPTMSKQSLATIEIEGNWKRSMTPAERKVNFAGIENKLNSLEGETERTIKPIWDALVKDAMVKIDKYVVEGMYDKIEEKNIFDENIKNQYIKAIKEAGLEAYIYGKNGASDELGVKAPQTPKESKDYFRDNAKMIVDKQLADLIFKIQAEVGKGRRKDQLSKTQLSAGEIISMIGEIFVGYYSENIGLTAIATVATGVNKGRKDTFGANAKDIYGYQYSALLDNRTCQTCAALDGKVLDEAQYQKTNYDPPLHFSCRCIWVAIMADELEPPPITGMPDDFAGLVEPSLSRNVEEQIVELGRRAVQDEVTRLLAED
jgi:SPP1 gp7 family putative phage head morphogenesis protein